MKKSTLKQYLPKQFKGLTKKYMLEQIFNEDIQKNWNPTTGDIMVGKAGNVFVISNTEQKHASIGGTVYYFGGTSCNRNGGCVLDDTICYTANESGIWYHPIKGKQENPYHSCIRDFRYVPYPHEIAAKN